MDPKVDIIPIIIIYLIKFMENLTIIVIFLILYLSNIKTLISTFFVKKHKG